MANDVFDNVIEELSTLFEAMTGINQAPEHPPEGINDPPMVVTYYVETDVEYSLTYSRTLSTVYADVLLSRAHCRTSRRRRANTSGVASSP